MDEVPTNDDSPTVLPDIPPEVAARARLDPHLGEAPQDAATAAAQAQPDPAAVRDILENRNREQPITRKGFFSDRVDRWLFLLFTGIGVAIVATLKLGFSVYDIWTALPPVLILIGYAATVRGQRYFRLHPDRLGDNCYYMGFIFTLASLSFALMQLESIVGNARISFLDSLIGNFGIALFSTIAGITLRVYFIQFRREVEDEEEQIRQDLEVVANRLKDQLSLAVLDLEGFRLRTGQVLEERLIQATEEFARVQQGMVRQASAGAESLATLQTNAAEAVARVQQGMARDAGAAAEKLAAVQNAAAEAFGRVQQRMARDAGVTTERLAALQTDATEAFGRVQEGMVREAGAAAEKLATLQENATETFARVQHGMAREAGARAEAFAAFQIELAERAAAAAAAMNTSATDLTGSADKVAKAVRELIRRVERIETPPDLLVRHLQQAEARISNLAVAIERVADNDTRRSEAFERATSELLKQLVLLTETSLTETSKFSRFGGAVDELHEQLTSLTGGIATYQQAIDGLALGAKREQLALTSIRESLLQDAQNSSEALRSLEGTLSDIARGIAARLG